MEPEDFLDWLEKSCELYRSRGEAYPEFTIDDLITDFKRDYALGE